MWFGPLRAALVLCHPDSLRVILSNHVPKEEFVYSLIVPFTGKQVNEGNSMEMGWEKGFEGRSFLRLAFGSTSPPPRPYYILFIFYILFKFTVTTEMATLLSVVAVFSCYHATLDPLEGSVA